MTPERLQQIEDLYHSALEQDSAERAAFIDDSCNGDEELRHEVESLLASHEQAGDFIEAPVHELGARLIADNQKRSMVGRAIGHYVFLEFLGAGGMGEVYLARDKTLGRQVALKLLPDYFTKDADRLRRFEQEARAASSLNHPNIVTIYEIGQADGHHFIATESINGMTLRERMAKTRLELGQALDVAIQVAAALEAAHGAGIAHRDIKPENLMLRRDGYVKVLDFGLAKLAERPASTVDTEAATRVQIRTDPGMVMGTAQYMSPEQARGVAVDARTDIWSLGVVLYEMVAGLAPFGGETPSHVIVSLMEKEAPPLSRSLPVVPAELDRIVNKALRKNRDERYQTVKDFLLDLKSLKQQVEVEAHLERSTRHEGAPITLPGIPITHPASSAEYIVSEIKNHKRSAVLVLATLVVAVAVAGYFVYFAKSEAIDSVAIMPFVNVSGDANTEYLSDGLSDSIINSLSQVPNLKVIALNSVLRYKGETDPQVIGRKLNVRAVLMSRLIQQGADLSVSTELIDVRDNRRLWGQQYNRKLADITAVQTEIAQEISERLRLRLTGEEKKRLTKRYTESGGAYQFYMMGRYYARKRTKEGWEKSIEYFNQAIEKDPAYAPAYVELAFTYGNLGFTGLLTPKEARQKQERAALKAMEIDDTLAEAHVAMERLRALDLNWSAAEEERKRALELNPNSVDAQDANTYLVAFGRFDEVMPHLERAQELDPLSPTIHSDAGIVFYFARQYDRANEQLQKALELDPNFAPAHARLALTYLAKGMYEEAITEQKKSIALEDPSGRWRRTAFLGYVYSVMGKREEAQKILNDLKEVAKQRYVSPHSFALIYIGLGDKDQGFAYLEKAFEERPDSLNFIKVSPQFDSLRSDPRFTDLLRRMKLAP